MTDLMIDRTREAVPVMWHGVKRGWKLLGALYWLALGLAAVWLFWTVAALPDDALMQSVREEDLNELRNQFCGCLVVGVLIAVYGLHKIRQWFRPAAIPNI